LGVGCEGLGVRRHSGDEVQVGKGCGCFVEYILTDGSIVVGERVGECLHEHRDVGGAEKVREVWSGGKLRIQ